MSNTKNIEDLAPSTLDRMRRNKIKGEWPYSFLWKRAVDRLSVPEVSDAARTTYLILQPILRNANPAGFLVDDEGEPMTSQDLAVRTRFPKGLLGKGLRELKKLGIFKERDGFIYDVLMNKTESEGIEKSEKSNMPIGYSAICAVAPFWSVGNARRCLGSLLVGRLILAKLAQPIYHIILSGLLQKNSNQDDDCEKNERHSPVFNIAVSEWIFHRGVRP
jgi:hypothetical protein